MIKVVATEFDHDAWERTGLSWMRTVKSAGFHGIVIDKGISQAAKNTLKEVKFRVASYGESKVAPYSALLNELKENERCLWCAADYNLKDTEPFFTGVGLVATCDNSLPVDNMVMSIANIRRRAEAAGLIEQKVVPVHGSLLDTKLLCGGVEDWAGFVGYFEFLVTSSFLEARSAVDRMALNLYAANFPGKLTTV